MICYLSKSNSFIIACFSSSVIPLARTKAATNSGSEPPNLVSTILTLSIVCASSFLTSDVTIAFSDFIIPLSLSRFITVYVVDFFHSSFSLHSFTSSVLLTGSFSHNILQKLYSLSYITGCILKPLFRIILWLKSNTLDLACQPVKLYLVPFLC